MKRLKRRAKAAEIEMLSTKHEYKEQKYVIEKQRAEAEETRPTLVQPKK